MLADNGLENHGVLTANNRIGRSSSLDPDGANSSAMAGGVESLSSSMLSSWRASRTFDSESIEADRLTPLRRSQAWRRRLRRAPEEQPEEHVSPSAAWSQPSGKAGASKSDSSAATLPGD